MAPFDPVLHDHERRMKMMAALRRDTEERIVAMDAMGLRIAAHANAGEVRTDAETPRRFP
ncbi:MAG: hypothetical protein ABSH50_30435 [Bryobacteraceae bacterium]|jgi:hypothetical protein